MKGFIVGLAPGTREYTVNGVKYVVGAKFLHRQSKDNFADRIKKFITSDFAHLSVDTQDDIIEAEYVCYDCEASEDAGKTNYEKSIGKTKKILNKG